MPAKLQQLQNLFFEGASQEEFLRIHKGEKRTWKYLYGEKPDLVKHIAGKTYYGVKRGMHTRFIVLDFDNHHWEHDIAWHRQRVLGAIQWLMEKKCRVFAEFNKANGSTKVFLFLPRLLPIADAEARAAQLLARLDKDMPGYNYAAAEVFPGKLSGYFLPFRDDKFTLMPTKFPVLGKRRFVQPWQVRDDEKRLERDADLMAALPG